MIETRRIVRILTDLEGINEDLINLFDDIRLNIDRSAHGRTQGALLLAEYSKKLDDFEIASSALRAVIESITQVDLEHEKQTQAEAATAATQNAVANERIIQALDHEQPHTLDEDFTSKRPSGFTISGRAFRDLHTWRRLYQMFCQHLATRDSRRYSSLPAAAPFRANLGSRFDHSTQGFRSPLKLAGGLYAEGNVSAETVRHNIRHLLDYFGIPKSEMTVYLREDRDAERV